MISQRHLRDSEPSLDELLDDRVMRLLLASDGVSVEALRALVGETGRKWRAIRPVKAPDLALSD